MPRVHEEEGCRFYIYTDDHEPPHVHVRVGDGEIVLNLNDDATLRRVDHLKQSEVKKAQRLVKANRGKLLNAWRQIHG